MSRSGGADEPVLSMENVSVEFTESKHVLQSVFGDPDTVHAVDDVSLDIGAGEVIALIGESGCGKTTLGKAAIGLQRQTHGTISYRGQDVWAAKDGVGDVSIPYDEIRRSLQIIHQDPGSALNPYQTVEKTLSLPLKRWHDDLDANDRRARIKSMLDYVGMQPADEYLHRYPHQLSGGEQQRVALIRTLLVNPDLVLADEAVSALDVSLRVEMMDLMLELREHFDTAYLFISHDLANARYLAGKADGRIGVMYLGEIVEIGPVDQIIDHPRHPYTKALHWAAATIDPDDRVEDPPIRKIDIPDPVDLPSGCRFHTRCPEARAVCAERAPSLVGRDAQAACFREYDDHEYWQSEPIDDAPAPSD